ncbi:molybdopterin converting factor subunit 1 [Deinococcus sp. KNUC1210]|uniref:molybdopterin converting factor subunit 1 n=1 Tax=Deinococcus sp. KNUC1210 TaxID=2917691 RepID=UPI001EF076EB|nr:molybdopterin converting factor subunit 1 [Deinococcus sp. KNUC1210]ULH14537.1 molybdopterin converting factor subunit 1 [Deinococcus sp. KNUC1210]
MIHVVLFARLKREAGLESLDIPLPDPPTVRAVAAAVEARHALSLRGCMVAVNEAYADPEQTVSDGDEVAFLPPVAGGDDTDFCRVTPNELHLEEASAFLVRPEFGAQAYFVGTVRSPNQGKTVEAIEYEGYAPMAEKVMQAAADLARQQHGELLVWIEHRTGRLTPGQASILIGVGSPHRRAALEACDFLIEHLKVVLPVWKLEADEDGEHWVKGQTGSATL